VFRSFQVARIRGIAIEIHPSWLLILGLITWTLAEGFFPDQYPNWSNTAYWVVGGSAALLLFVTVLVHELAHAFVATRRGLPVPKITLFIFGGVSQMAQQPRTAGEEFAIAAAGPATSLVIAIVAAAAGYGLRNVNEQAEAIAYYLAVVNTLLAFFNLLPGFPLDGGRVLRSLAWRRTGSFRRATEIAGGVGETFGYALMAGGVVLLLAGAVLDGLWFLFIGWFLLSAAKGESQNLQLEGILAKLKARDVMHEDFASVTPAHSVQQVVDDYMIGRGDRAVVVADDRGVLGLITVSDVGRVPRETWANTPVQGIMTPREKVITVPADAVARDVLVLIGEHRLNQIPVLDGGRMIGMITRRELLDRIQLAEKLAPAAPADKDEPAT
jgi:Zn-dependent protease/predicted transcriptional regulator